MVNAGGFFSGVEFRPLTSAERSASYEVKDQLGSWYFGWSRISYKEEAPRRRRRREEGGREGGMFGAEGRCGDGGGCFQSGRFACTEENYL